MTRLSIATLGAYLIVYGCVSAVGLSLLKLSLSAMPAISVTSALGVLRDWRFGIGFALYALGFTMWMALLQRGDLTVVFPIAAGTLFLAVAICGSVFLHEPLGLGRILGMTLILSGVAVMSLAR